MENPTDKKRVFEVPPEKDNKLDKIFERLRGSFDDQEVNKMIKEIDDELLEDDVDHKEKSEEFNKRKNNE